MNDPQRIKVTPAKMPVTPGNITAREIPANPDDITLTIGKLTVRRRRLLGTVIFSFKDVDGVERKIADDSLNIERMIAASVEGSGEELDHTPRHDVSVVEPLQPDPRHMTVGSGLGPDNRLNSTRYV